MADAEIAPKRRGNLSNDVILKEIAGGLAALKYGEILIKVHDSRIIQVEKTEKVRYDPYYGMVQGGGI
ncbi:MAG: YezD family protein [Candidatus Omnitrophota bacterium]